MTLKWKLLDISRTFKAFGCKTAHGLIIQYKKYEKENNNSRCTEQQHYIYYNFKKSTIKH